MRILIIDDDGKKKKIYLNRENLPMEYLKKKYLPIKKAGGILFCRLT